jgi:uncharacterized membrane protein (UPF0127 family)
VADWVIARNQSRDGQVLARAKWCSTFASKLRGSTFRRRLEPGTGLILVEPRPGRLATAIHMAFVFFPLGVAWLDADGCVVDLRVARPWGVYVPCRPARYVLEGPPAMLECLSLGDLVAFHETAPDT